MLAFLFQFADLCELFAQQQKKTFQALLEDAWPGMAAAWEALGAVEISQTRYLSLLDGALAGAGVAAVSAGGRASLASALPVAGDFSALESLVPPADPDLPTFTVSGPVSGQLIVQLLTQTS